MKFTSLIAMAATVAGLAGAAHADEHEFTFGASALTIDVDGVGELEANSTDFGSRGEYDFGLRYDLDITSISGDDLPEDRTMVELDVRHMLNDNFGIAAAYDAVTEGDIDEDVVGFGLATEYTMGSTELFAALTSDVDNFLTDYKLEAGVRHDVNAKVMVFADAKKTHADEDVSVLSAGARYALFDSAFLEGKVARWNAEDLSIDTVGLNVGFGF